MFIVINTPYKTIKDRFDSNYKWLLYLVGQSHRPFLSLSLSLAFFLQRRIIIFDLTNVHTRALSDDKIRMCPRIN